MTPPAGEATRPGPRSLRLLVNAGPTREYFDTVRFITNASSGRQGYAIAEEAARRGHAVTLVSGPVSLPAPAQVRIVPVVSAAEMSVACRQVFAGCDAAILTAAVCDYRPQSAAGRKLKKQDQPLSITLEPTEDICATLGREKADRILVGFAMEDHDPMVHAESKLTRKNCDLMVLNGPENVGAERAAVRVLSALTGWGTWFSGSKQEVASHLLDQVEQLAAARHNC